MKKLSNFLKKDKLNSADQLIFIDYLRQALINGYSLNASLRLLPKIWRGNSSQLLYVNQRVEEGSQLGDVLQEVGFSSTLAAQINLAVIDGNLLSCLDQMSKLIRLKNKQLKKLKGELAYPALLVGMMVTLLICMQTFLKTEVSDNDWTSNVMLGGLVLLVIVAVFFISKTIRLLNKQDYYALKKLTNLPMIGAVLRLYVHYLVVSDLAVLLINGFSLQKICQLTAMQPDRSLQQVIGVKVKDQLEKGTEIKEIIEQEFFIPNNLVMLLETGTTRKEIGKRALLLSKTLFYELNLKLNSLILNIQPICFIFIGICILGMYLKILMPMYHLMELCRGKIKLKNKQVKGFTLVEMVIVIAIIAMLILLIVPGLSKQKDRATSKTDEALRTTIETQRQLAEDNGDGTSLEELVKKEYISQKQKERYEKLPQK